MSARINGSVSSSDIGIKRHRNSAPISEVKASENLASPSLCTVSSPTYSTAERPKDIKLNQTANSLLDNGQDGLPYCLMELSDSRNVEKRLELRTVLTEQHPRVRLTATGGFKHEAMMSLTSNGLRYQHSNKQTPRTDLATANCVHALLLEEPMINLHRTSKFIGTPPVILASNVVKPTGCIKDGPLKKRKEGLDSGHKYAEHVIDDRVPYALRTVATPYVHPVGHKYVHPFCYLALPHTIVTIKSHGTCKHCGSLQYHKCGLCDVPLCDWSATGRLCYWAWHAKKRYLIDTSRLFEEMRATEIRDSDGSNHDFSWM